MAEARSRSQTENKEIFWVAALDDQIDRVTVEVFREGLEPGAHEAKVTIEDMGGGEETQDVTVRVEILPPPPDIS